MTLNELIERMRTENPDAIGKLPDAAVVRLLRAAFGTVSSDLAQAQDGVYKVGALGVFRVRTVEPNAEGKGGGRRVLFSAAPARPAAEGAKPAK